MSEFPEVPKGGVSDQVKKRNRVIGLSLFAFIIALGVVSYYAIARLTP